MDPAEWSFDTISSDTIRGDLMAPLMANGKTRDQAFQATAKSGPQAYAQAFERKCDEAIRGNKGKNHVIFLDKNHPVNGIRRVNEDIRKNFSKSRGFNVRKLYMIPQESTERPSRVKDLPFPENFLFQIYAWGQSRGEHETLDNSNPHNMLEIQTMFLKMTRNVVFNQSFLDKN